MEYLASSYLYREAYSNSTYSVRGFGPLSLRNRCYARSPPRITPLLFLNGLIRAMKRAMCLSTAIAIIIWLLGHATPMFFAGAFYHNPYKAIAVDLFRVSCSSSERCRPTFGMDNRGVNT